MPRPVCVKCSTEMVVHRVGVVVTFKALASSHPTGAYQQRRADTVQCPVCKIEVVWRYADSGWEHYHKGVQPDPADITVEERGPLRVDPVKPHKRL